jgi:hypothetical protein
MRFMPQLVGRNCVRCSARIVSELDARFCSGCGQPVHSACIPGEVPTAAGVCPLCGNRKPDRPPEPSGSPSVNSNDLALALKWGLIVFTALVALGALALFVIAVVQTIREGTAEDPRFLGSLLRRLGARIVLFGIALYLLRGFIWQKRGKSTPG